MSQAASQPIGEKGFEYPRVWLDRDPIIVAYFFSVQPILRKFFNFVRNSTRVYS